MSAMWTPGPWRAFENEHTGESWVIPNAGGMLVAQCNVRNPFDPEQMANARLIAAAPDLYAALENLLALVVGECPRLLENDHHWEMATEVLRKARGEP